MKSFLEWIKERNIIEESDEPKIYQILQQMFPLSKLAATGQITPDNPDERLRQLNGLAGEAVKYINEMSNNPKVKFLLKDLDEAIRSLAWGNYGETSEDYKEKASDLYMILQSVLYALGQN